MMFFAIPSRRRGVAFSGEMTAYRVRGSLTRAALTAYRVRGS
jgi:hypothetical protein